MVRWSGRRSSAAFERGGSARFELDVAEARVLAVDQVEQARECGLTSDFESTRSTMRKPSRRYWSTLFRERLDAVDPPRDAVVLEEPRVVRTGPNSSMGCPAEADAVSTRPVLLFAMCARDRSPLPASDTTMLRQADAYAKFHRWSPGV